jgi:hypothetical protein
MASEKYILSKSLSFGLGKIRRGSLSERRASLKYGREAGYASDARSLLARKYARGGGRFVKLLKFAKLDAKLLEHNFSILPKIDGFQVDLANFWRCSPFGWPSVPSKIALDSVIKKGSDSTSSYGTASLVELVTPRCYAYI